MRCFLELSRNKHLLNLYAFILFFSNCSVGQEIERVDLNIKDVWGLYQNDNDKDGLFFLKMLPEQEIKGVLVILPSGYERVDDVLKQVDLHIAALKKGFAVVVPSINWSSSDGKAEFKILDTVFEQLVEIDKVPKNKFIIGGLSNGGMIALKYAQLSVKTPDLVFLRPAGIFALDTPLDEAHLYEYSKREIKRNFAPAGVNEAKWMLNNFNDIYGGSPTEFPQKYIEASIFSYGVEKGGNAQYLKDIPIRMYTDLDLDFLLNKRRRDLYDWNGTNIVAMINELKIMGNPDVNVIVTMGKGKRLDGTRHPHSWSIIDTKDCLGWIEKLLIE